MQRVGGVSQHRRIGSKHAPIVLAVEEGDATTVQPEDVGMRLGTPLDQSREVRRRSYVI